MLKLGVFFRVGFRTRFFGYDDFERAFIRVQEVNGRMCCGKAVFSYCRMVLVRDGKEIANYMSENESAMDPVISMAERFAGITSSVEREDLTPDFESAEVFDKFPVAKLGVFFPAGFRPPFRI